VNIVLYIVWSSDYIWLVFLHSVMAMYQISLRVFTVFYIEIGIYFFRKKSRHLSELPDTFIFGWR